MGIPVTTKPLAELAIYPVYSAPATVISINDAHVSAEITGKLVTIPVQVGDTVEKNQLIAQLDCQAHVFAAQQAKALLKAAQAEAKFSHFQLERAQSLLKTKAVSEEMLNEREAQARKADAEIERLAAALDTAELHVEKCDIQAPFKAVVIERSASVGELMAPGSVVARLLDRENLEVSGNVQEQDLERLRSAKVVRFVSGERSYPLSLRVVIPFIESKLRSYEVRFSFTRAQAAPGEAGRVEWESARRHLPSELLVRRGEKLGVFIEDQGRAQFLIIAQALEGNPVPLDLPDKAAIIVDGRFQLKDGDPVQVINP